MRSFRTDAEKQVGIENTNIFLNSPDSIETKLENFPKYVRRQHLKRFLAMYEIFKRIVNVKGSVVECGVYKGFGLMSWAKISTILEPENLTRRIYGFDTFEGFPDVSQQDLSEASHAGKGALNSNSREELMELIVQYDSDRFLGHINKVQLFEGDAVKTIPEFLTTNPHLIVSLLFLDFDLYEPTKIAIEQFLPRMPKGALIVFDELDNPIWPGETLALLDSVGIQNLRLERIAWDPYISYAVIE